MTGVHDLTSDHDLFDIKKVNNGRDRGAYVTPGPLQHEAREIIALLRCFDDLMYRDLFFVEPPAEEAIGIAGVVRENGRAEVQAIGAGAVNQAIKALVLATGYLKNDGIDVACVPEFADVAIDDKIRTAIKFVIEPRKSRMSGFSGVVYNAVGNLSLRFFLCSTQNLSGAVFFSSCSSRPCVEAWFCPH